MHEFKYKRNYLYCENIKVLDLAKRFGTPLYIYSYRTLVDHFLKLKAAFREIAPLICYSVKACSNLSILRALVDKGSGLDIVSGGELFRALKAGNTQIDIKHFSHLVYELNEQLVFDVTID